MSRVFGASLAALLLASLPAQASCSICGVVCMPRCCLTIYCRMPPPSCCVPCPQAPCWGVGCLTPSCWGVGCQPKVCWGVTCLKPCCPPCGPCGPCPTPCYRPEMHVAETRVTFPQHYMREVVSQQPVTTMTPEWKDEKRTRTVTTMQETTYERSFPVKTSVPTTVVDPCTGCPMTVYKTVTKLQSEKRTVMVPVQKKEEYTQRVMVMKPEQKMQECRQLVPDVRAVPVVRQEPYMLMVPVNPVGK